MKHSLGFKFQVSGSTQMAYDNNGGGGYGGGQGGDFPPRKMYSGSWNCSKCGKEITELPFEPDPARLDKLLCRDCHKERQQSFKRNYR